MSVHVVGVVLIAEPRVLVAKRRDSGFWEFPGGKQERGESEAECALREIQEELEVTIEVGSLLDRFEYSDREHEFDFAFYAGRIIDGVPRAIEHETLRWVARSELEEFQMHPADRRVARLLQDGHSLETF